MQRNITRLGRLCRMLKLGTAHTQRGSRPRRLQCEALEDRRLLSASATPPSGFDQYLLELINRGRANPSAEASRYRTALNEGLAPGTIASGPKQPLAFNVNLGGAASGHSQWMLNTDNFSHTGAGGTDPGDRMANAGYASPSTFGWAENIAWSGSSSSASATTATTESLHRALYVDSGIPGRGHRVNLMSPDLKEAGIAVRTGVFAGFNAVMITEDFAYRTGSSFLTGVAYDDRSVSNNDFYTPGEGLGGVTVTATRLSDSAVFTTTTWASGGYSLRLAPGTYRVTASGGSLGGTVNVPSVSIRSDNVKVDFTTDMLHTNRPPSFAKGANQNVREGAGLQTVANWATRIAPGPAGESDQTVRFLVSNNNRSLFSRQPAIAPDGTLTFAPKSGAAGTATVTVRAKDSGGTAHGGQDTSAAQTFVIKVAWNPRPVVQVPAGGDAGNLVVRRNGKNLQVVDSQTRHVLRQQPLASMKKLTITGAANRPDRVSVDFRTGGTFDLAEGIAVDGGAGTQADTLVLTGTSGADRFTSASSRAALARLSVFFAGIERLILDGGKGNDLYQVSDLIARTTIMDSGGADALDFGQAAVGVAIDLSMASGQPQQVFASNGNTLALKGTFEKLIGSPFADRIKGNSASNRIDGRGGDDAIHGGPGNDALYGGDGDDGLYGEAGNDSLFGGAGNNVVVGGPGNDTSDGRRVATAGGATEHDENLAALDWVLAEWTSSATITAKSSNSISAADAR